VKKYQELLKRIESQPKVWLITGAAGFIGSHLLESLLALDQIVVGLDNFSTGSRENLALVRDAVGEARWRNFRLIEGDIRSPEICYSACKSVDIVLHQAALGSVPRSVEAPVASNDNNVNGFLNMLVAARDSHVGRFVYASSSSIYGDDAQLPKVETRVGRPLSPYAVTKYVDELYAGVFASCYGMNLVGLRYFNVFGPRQSPDGAYAAVIPKWIAAFLNHEPIQINGDGTTARDFCFVENAVQANFLAALVDDPNAVNQNYNVALNGQTSLNELLGMLRDRLALYDAAVLDMQPEYREFRWGDMKFSRADISKAQRLLGYQPVWPVKRGLEETIDWYVKRSTAQARSERKSSPPIPDARLPQRDDAAWGLA